jgi:hypothetical protein
MNNLAKLKFKKANASAAAQFKPAMHHPNMTSAQIKAVDAANRAAEQKQLSAFNNAGKQIVVRASSDALLPIELIFAVATRRALPRSRASLRR